MSRTRKFLSSFHEKNALRHALHRLTSDTPHGKTIHATWVWQTPINTKHTQRNKLATVRMQASRSEILAPWMIKVASRRNAPRSASCRSALQSRIPTLDGLRDGRTSYHWLKANSKSTCARAPKRSLLRRRLGRHRRTTTPTSPSPRIIIHDNY